MNRPTRVNLYFRHRLSIPCGFVTVALILVCALFVQKDRMLAVLISAGAIAAAGASSASAQEVATNATELARNAEQLRALAGRFTVSS